MKTRYIILTVVVIIIIGAVLAGPIMSDVEQAKYTVVSQDGDIEIRDYAPMIVAETVVSGERSQAISQGFKIIADYIFGNNQGSQKVAMTAPVMQNRSETIPMTAPVTQQGNDTGWIVRFVMPASYTLSSLPQPKNSAVKIVMMTSQKFAVIRFSGTATSELLAEKQNQLVDYMRKNNLTVLGDATFAFYNPPWTLPFLRHNEVMIATN